MLAATTPDQVQAAAGNRNSAFKKFGSQTTSEELTKETITDGA